MTIVQFIIEYLAKNPGSKYSDITKAICKFRGKAWTRGHYSRYFTTYQAYTWHDNGETYPQTIYPGRLWAKYEGKWYLTPRGQSRLMQTAG